MSKTYDFRRETFNFYHEITLSPQDENANKLLVIGDTCEMPKANDFMIITYKDDNRVYKVIDSEELERDTRFSRKDCKMFQANLILERMLCQNQK